MSIPIRVAPRLTLAHSPQASRKDLRLWLGVGLIIFASLLGGKLFASASHRTPAVVVIHELAEGSIIRASDVQLMNVALPVGITAASSLDEVVGKVITHDVMSGSILNPVGVSDESNLALRSISVPIKAGHLPIVDYGSRVDVWFTPSMDGAVAPGPSQLLATDVLVEAVPTVFDNSIDTAITLRVSETVVAQMMQALRDGSIDLAGVDEVSHD